METTFVRILKEDLQRVNELAQSKGKTQWQVISDLLNNTHESNQEPAKVSTDKEGIKNCLYDRYEYKEGKITYECPILQKFPSPIADRQDAQKELLPFCKVCKRYQIMLMKLKNYYQPQKTSSYNYSKKKQHEDFGETAQEPTWHEIKSGDWQYGHPW